MRRSKLDQETCSKCWVNQKRSGGRWCHACHAEDQALRRAKLKAEILELRATVAQLRASPASKVRETA